MKTNINTIKMLGVDMINKANSGHPGIVLGAATMMHTLYNDHMKINPLESNWINRDRFVMSAGHGSALLYAMLHVAGFKLSIEDLKNFRQKDSLTPGHPENFITDGVDAASGPLGQGIAHAVGIALAETKSADMFNTKEHKIFDHHTYAICGDGDLQEGVAQEAMSLAGNLKLEKLIVLYDSNEITLDGALSNSNTENNKMKMESMHWNYIVVADGEKITDVSNAIKEAKKSKKPTMIEVRTIIGRGTSVEGTNKAHGSPVGEAGRPTLVKNLGYDKAPFEVEQSVYDHFKKKNEAHQATYDAWNKTFVEWMKANPDLAKVLGAATDNKLKIDSSWFPAFKKEDVMATRASSGKVLDAIQAKVPYLIGGSADLTSSTKVKGLHGDFTAADRSGNNINYGIREFGMAAVNNGISLHGVLRPFSSGFFVFADYAKPAIRLSSLMETNALHIYTHDSVAVGEDGPTHQPVEQLAGFRAQPDLFVFRPADANEVCASYKVALEMQVKPSLLVMSRQGLPMISEDMNGALKGAYIVRQETKELADKIIVAAGSEVSLALQVAEELNKFDIDVRVVSMPCVELFEEQSFEYKESVLPKNRRLDTIAIEMSSDTVWYRYADKVAGINSFGKSAPGNQVIEAKGFGKDNLVNIIKEW